MPKILLLLCWVFCCCLFVAGQQPQGQPNPAPDISKKVYIFSFKGEIDDKLSEQLLNKFKAINVNETKAIILEIDTPGGLVTSALDVCRDIKAMEDVGIPVYAYITGFAWSGGALVSLACTDIYMVGQASIGSAQVKMITPFGIQDADEKSLSAMRAHFRAHAESHAPPYHKALAEAMVDPALQVHEIIFDGEKVFRTSDELQKLLRENGPTRVQDKGVVVPAGKLANFTAQEAVSYGFCKSIAATRTDLLQKLNLANDPTEEVSLQVPNMFFAILTNRWLQMFLFALGILGLFIEFWTPGTFFPGLLGLLCFALAFLGCYFAGTAEIWEIVVFAIGLILLAIEIFLIPGFGVVGITGIICIFAGILLSFQTFVLPNSEDQVNEMMQNFFKLALSLGLDIVAIMIIIRFLPEGAPLRRLSVATVQKVEDGYSVAIPSYQNLVGKVGIVSAALRPAGRVDIEGTTYDVVSQGDFLEVNCPIKVVQVQGNRITVDKC